MQMEYANKRFTQEELMLLERMKGSELLSIDAVLAAPPDNSYNTVRLHFVDFDIDINNYLSDLAVDEFGSLEEFGLPSITEASKDILSIPAVGTDTTIFQVNKTIKGVTVINDIADIFGDGSQVARLEYPQAVALETDDGIIMLDKEVWFSELIVIKNGDSIGDLLYDESVNWEDNPEEDPSTHFEFRTEAQEL